MRILLALVLGSIPALPLDAGEPAEPAPTRPVATYSIVARDPGTGELGVAVQSHWFSVGSVVPWAASGVGAIATQSFVEVSYGPQGLAAMREGLSAQEALTKLLALDQAADVRQIAFVDAQGRVASHTGERCIPGAGHTTGRGYSVQANIMLTDDVPQTMARAYEASSGPLAQTSQKPMSKMVSSISMSFPTSRHWEKSGPQTARQPSEPASKP